MGEEKGNQEDFIKTLLLRCKGDPKEQTWQMPEMVYYTDPAPMAPMDATPSIKKLVCSPDLPISNPPPLHATAPAPIQCPTCPKQYTSKSAYQSHQRTHHPTKPPTSDDPYRCNICAKTFAVPARLTRHYRTHTGEKPFRCEFCHKSFSVKENLSVHRRIHTKERPYKCEVCSRAFEHSGKLHRHMRIHTGERPHKCSVCAKTFIQSGQLVIHMRTHTGEKPYVCAVCSKGFTCSKQLKVHSRTHTGEKPYSCEICGKSFGYNHVLKLHQVAHYGEKVYKCTICNDTFNSKKSMEAHIKSHAEQPPPAPLTPPATESSCSSTGSDKENLAYEGELRYFMTYQRDPYQQGVELLAAAAAASEPQDVVFNLIKRPAYFAPSYASLQAGEDIRRKVEAALEVVSEEEAILTPPSSSPVSPAPSVESAPDPELSLPPRKRSKMILKSMEADLLLSPVRYNTVIHYAKAS